MKERLTSSLSENLNLFHSVFQEDTTIKFRQLCCGMDKRCVAVIFADGMVNDTIINEHIVQSLVTFTGVLPREDCASFLRRRVLFADDILEKDGIQDLPVSYTHLRAPRLRRISCDVVFL